MERSAHIKESKINAPTQLGSCMYIRYNKYIKTLNVRFINTFRTLRVKYMLDELPRLIALAIVECDELRVYRLIVSAALQANSVRSLCC